MGADLRPPFNAEAARVKVKAAENAWNTRDPEVVAKAALSFGVTGCNVTIYNPDMDPDGRFARRIVGFLDGALTVQPAPTPGAGT